MGEQEETELYPFVHSDGVGGARRRVAHGGRRRRKAAAAVHRRVWAEARVGELRRGTRKVAGGSIGGEEGRGRELSGEIELGGGNG